MKLPYLFVALLVSGTALADSTLGTLTVKGKTAILRHAYVTRETDPDGGGQQYIVFLLADRKLAAGDRQTDRLQALAKQGQVHALKVRWAYGLDDISCVLYDGKLADSGLTQRGKMILDLRALDDRDVKAHVRSKMLGQEWQFQARLEATIRPGQVVELEAPADEVLPGDGTQEASSQGPVGGGKDDGAVLAMKRELGRLGLEATPEGFDQAVRGGNVEAVRLFLRLGMNPNARDFRGEHLLMVAVTFCATARGDKEVAEKRGDVVLALLEAGSDVHGGKEPRSAMTLIWATRSCPPRVVQAMIEKGADVNARAPGGGTALMVAKFRQDGAGEEVAAILRKAGAKE